MIFKEAFTASVVIESFLENGYTISRESNNSLNVEVIDRNSQLERSICFEYGYYIGR